MATNLIGTFNHETNVGASEEDIPKYGYLINRGKACNIEVMTFGGETVYWTLGENESSQVKVRKLISVSGMDGVINVLWNDDDQKAKPIDPPAAKANAYYDNIIHNGHPVRRQ